MVLEIKSRSHNYNVNIVNGGINRVSEYFDLNRKVLIVTDSGVPKNYAETVSRFCPGFSIIATVNEGENSKSIESYTYLIKTLIENNFTRKDCIVAVGGGVVGDLSGFVASTYMRGIDFYNVPTTVLSQVDSSVGGKVAIDFGGIKNIVGAFWAPKGVLIDINVLTTLPERQISNGLAESVKMSLTCDRELFEIFENADIIENLEQIIYRSILIKKSVVEADETEQGLRKILNFGHTVAHGIESDLNFSEWYHGECVAIGMLPMTAKTVRERLVKVLKKLNLPTTANFDIQNVLTAISHDKKSVRDGIDIITVDEIGKFNISTVKIDDIQKRISEVL